MTIQSWKNPFNQNFTSRNPIDRKVRFLKYIPDQELYFRLLDEYTLLPDTLSKDLKNWAEENKKTELIKNI